MIASSDRPEGSLINSAECESFFWRDVVAIVVTCILWAVMAFLIDPRGNFPLIDDWAYGLPVRALVDRGELRLTDWSAATLIAQVYWGALFCLPTGFSFFALRISTLIAGLIGLVAMYGLIRRLGARQTVAMFATWTLGTNAVFICLSYTFMTDILFIALVILSSMFLISGMSRDRDDAIWLGLGLALVSVFVRQIGVALFLGFVVAYPFWRPLGRRWFVQALIPTLLAFATLRLYERFMIAREGLPMVYYKSNHAMAEFLGYMARARLGPVKTLVAKCWDLFLFLGLYTAPFSLVCWPSRLARLSRRNRLVELGWVAGLTLVVTTLLAATGGEVLHQYNIIYDFGAAPRFGDDDAMAGWPKRMPFMFNLGLKAVSVFGLVLALQAFGYVVGRILIRPRTSIEIALRSSVVFLIATCAFYDGAASFSFLLTFDRYFLAILPMALALIWIGQRAASREDPDTRFRLRPIGIIAGVISLVFYLTFATAATHDYLDWSRVRWNTAVALAEEMAVPATDVDGGWEYNNYIANVNRFYKSYRERELLMSNEEKQGSLWGSSLDRPFRVSSYLASGYQAIRKVPLSPWLPLAPGEFIVSKRINPPSQGR